jgi:N-acetylmuramoyl-L-alanine amidase
VADGLKITPDYVGGDYGRQATAAARPFKGIVIHVTGKPDLKSELDYMGHPDPNRPGYYGYHYLIDKDGSIYQTAPDNVRTNHIMPSGGFNNSNSLGIAFVGADKGMTDAQIAAGKQLVPQLQSQFNIPSTSVVSHGQLDPKTRGAGNKLGINDSAEGQQFVGAYRSGLNPRDPGYIDPKVAEAAIRGPSIGQPSRVATTMPGLTLNSSPMDLVANLESGNRNIKQGIVDANTARGTPAGGYFQIIDPTWARYAATAGVDLKQYPTAMSAPRDVQAKVASAIPVNQWGPNTVAALKAKYPGIDTSQTLGQIQSAAINPSGASTTVAGGPPVAGATGQPAAPSGGLPGFQPGSAGEKMAQTGLKQLTGGGGGGEQPPPPPLQMAQSQAMGGPMMMHAGEQNMNGRMAAMNDLAQRGFMVQPSLAAFTPPGVQPPVAPQMPGMATGMPALPGTTLNSPSQLQMALMTGSMSPYDMYGRNAGSM